MNRLSLCLAVIWVFFMLSTEPVFARTSDELQKCVQEYNATRYVYIETWDECVDYIYEQVLNYRGSVIIYTGKDSRTLTLSDVDSMIMEAFRKDDKDNLTDAAELWGNIASFQKGIAATREGVVLCVKVSYKHTQEEQEKYYQEIKKIIQELQCSHDIMNLSDEEKVRVVHDYICKRFDYDFSYTNYTGYDGFFNPIAGRQVMVCQGYSLLAYQLLNRCGIETNILLSETHSWNIVKLNGLYYQLDITNDDRGVFQKPVIYKYYLKAKLKGTIYEILSESTFYADLNYAYAEADYRVKRNISIQDMIVSNINKAVYVTRDNIQYVGAAAVIILLILIGVEGVEDWMQKKIKKSREKFKLYNSI